MHPSEGKRTPGSEFIHVARHVQHRCSRLDKPLDIRLRSVKKQLDASRLLKPEEFFLYYDCFFFVSMFALRKNKGNRRGRLWTTVAIDGMVELGGWEDRTERTEESKVLFLLILLCCSCQLVDYRVSCVVVERRNLFPPL